MVLKTTFGQSQRWSLIRCTLGVENEEKNSLKIANKIFNRQGFSILGGLNSGISLYLHIADNLTHKMPERLDSHTFRSGRCLDLEVSGFVFVFFLKTTFGQSQMWSLIRCTLGVENEEKNSLKIANKIFNKQGFSIIGGLNSGISLYLHIADNLTHKMPERLDSHTFRSGRCLDLEVSGFVFVFCFFVFFFFCFLIF